LAKKYDYVPISPKLIDHVRRLDAYNEQELLTLRDLLTGVAKKMKDKFSFTDKASAQDLGFRGFLETTMKIHQIFALIDVNYDQVFPSIAGTRSGSLAAHYDDIIKQFKQNDGLNYVPREKSRGGRCFEHACDSRTLIQHLFSLKGASSSKADIGSNFYVQIVDDKDGKTEEELNELKLSEKHAPQVYRELGISNENVVLKVSKPYVQLTMKA